MCQNRFTVVHVKINIILLWSYRQCVLQKLQLHCVNISVCDKFTAWEWVAGTYKCFAEPWFNSDFVSQQYIGHGCERKIHSQPSDSYSKKKLFEILISLSAYLHMCSAELHWGWKMVSHLVYYMGFIRHERLRRKETAEFEVFTGKCLESIQIVLSYVALLKMFCQLDVRQSRAGSACILKRILKVVNSMGQLVPAVSIPSFFKWVSESQPSYPWSVWPWAWQKILTATTIYWKPVEPCCTTLHSVVRFGCL